jgi:hypothetical protein
MTGFLFIRVETRVPRVVFAQDWPTETAFAEATGMTVQTKVAQRAMKSFFTSYRLVSSK